MGDWYCNWLWRSNVCIMKSRYTYLSLVILPLFVIYFIGVYYSSDLGILLLIFYVFIYRSYLDSKRLFDLGEITLEEYRKWWIPFYKSWWYPFKYFKKLYLK